MSHITFAVLRPDLEQLIRPLDVSGPPSRERWIILTAIAVVVVGLICWATFIRKRPRPRRGHIKRDRYSFGKSFAAGWADLKRIMALRQRERKRLRRRPRNPTRAEVGGLPPTRDETADGDPSQARSNY